MRLIAFTGKGGVGKSVLSSATALQAARLGYRTLLISSDPAHTLSDIFGSSVGGGEKKVADNLWALHVDPVDEMMKNYSATMEFIVELLRVKEVDETIAYELANFPGATGVSALLKAQDYDSKGSFEVLVMDMVPSGEALRLLYMPYVLSRFSRRMMKVMGSAAEIGRILRPITGMPMPSRNAIDKQIELLERMDRVRSLLLDFKRSSLRLVMNPDTFSIMNAKRAYMQSSIFGVNTDLVIVNKIMPPEIRDPYLTSLKEAQRLNLDQVEKDFKPLPVKKLKLYEEELRGPDMLKEAAKDLYGNEDPTRVYCRGRPIEVVRNGKDLELTLTARFPKKQDVQVERIGDELIVHVQTEAGKVNVLLPLPAVAFNYSLKEARLINERLHVVFGEQHAQQGGKEEIER